MRIALRTILAHTTLRADRAAPERGPATPTSPSSPPAAPVS